MMLTWSEKKPQTKTTTITYDLSLRTEIIDDYKNQNGWKNMLCFRSTKYVTQKYNVLLCDLKPYLYRSVHVHISTVVVMRPHVIILERYAKQSYQFPKFWI